MEHSSSWAATLKNPAGSGVARRAGRNRVPPARRPAWIPRLGRRPGKGNHRGNSRALTNSLPRPATRRSASTWPGPPDVARITQLAAAHGIRILHPAYNSSRSGTGVHPYHRGRPALPRQLPNMSRSWNGSVVPRPWFAVDRTPGNRSLSCKYTEPPIGIEPMTYALREAREYATGPLPARTARRTAPEALVAQEFRGHPVHDSVHAARVGANSGELEVLGQQCRGGR
jgi:hypothetical protein